MIRKLFEIFTKKSRDAKFNLEDHFEEYLNDKFIDDLENLLYGSKSINEQKIFKSFFDYQKHDLFNAK